MNKSKNLQMKPSLKSQQLDNNSNSKIIDTNCISKKLNIVDLIMPAGCVGVMINVWNKNISIYD